MAQNKSISIKSLMLVAILICINADAYSQSYTTPIGWHHTVFEARASALGQSTAALNNDTAYQMNPAVILEDGVIHASSFLFSATPYFVPQTGADLYSPAVSYTSGRLTFSALIDYTTHTPPADFGTIEGTYSNRLIRFRTGYRISEKLSVGAGIFHSLYKSPEFNSGSMEFGGDASGWGLDIGLLYRTRFESELFQFDPQAGLSLNTIGSGVDYEQRDMQDANLPGQISLGLGVDIKTAREVFDKPLFGLGIYTGFSKYLARIELNDDGRDLKRHGGFKALFTTWNSFDQFVGSQSDVITLGEQISASVGIELQFIESFYLRYGLIGGADSWVPPQHALGAELDFYYIALAVTHLNYHSSEQWVPRENSTYIQGTVRIPLDGNARDTLIGRLF